VKTAWSESVPTGSVVVASDAVPLVTTTGLPISVGVPVPTSNCTVPGADGVTVAVNVTEAPDCWGLAGDVPSVVFVLICVSGGYTTDQVSPLT
jgi:hypothetical protein